MAECGWKRRQNQPSGTSPSAPGRLPKFGLLHLDCDLQRCLLCSFDGDDKVRVLEYQRLIEQVELQSVWLGFWSAHAERTTLELHTSIRQVQVPLRARNGEDFRLWRSFLQQVLAERLACDVQISGGLGLIFEALISHRRFELLRDFGSETSIVV
jgi:hypothetical protein